MAPKTTKKSASKPKESKAAKAATSKPTKAKLPSTKSFLSFAPNMTAVLTWPEGSTELEVESKSFSTGTIGWGANGKAKVLVPTSDEDDAEMIELPVNISINITVPGSKPAKGAKGAEEEEEEEDEEEEDDSDEEEDDEPEPPKKKAKKSSAKK